MFAVTEPVLPKSAREVGKVGTSTRARALARESGAGVKGRKGRESVRAGVSQRCVGRIRLMWELPNIGQPTITKQVL